MMKLKEELLKVESIEEIIYEAIQMINNIEQYLLGNNYFITKQKEIGFKALFRGFIVRDWFDNDIEFNKYCLQNEVIVQEYVGYY